MGYKFIRIKSDPFSEINYSLMRNNMLIAASQASIVSRGDSARLQMAQIRGELRAVHWRAAARGLPASETAIETLRRDVFFSRQSSEAYFCSREMQKLRLQLTNSIQKTIGNRRIFKTYS